MDFDTAYAQLLGNEGGYTVDNGGPTNLGISQHSYPQEDILHMTVERSKFLYLRDFWGPAGCPLVPEVLRFELFDTAVNTSAPGNCRTAIMILQRALQDPAIVVDGVLGPKTLGALNALDPWRLLVRFMGARIAYYTHVQPALWAATGRGWMNRVSNNALRM